MTAETKAPAKPFLKWAGGKRQLLPELLRRVPEQFKAYHEPFVGGGALFFELACTGALGKAFLSDVNGPLVDAYLAVRDHVEEVIARLKTHRNEKEYYYRVRKQKPIKPANCAARLIYLNKTCYNGLYRENRSGQFNVPFGSYAKPNICDEGNLRSVSQVLQAADISRRSYTTVAEKARKGDFVYFDPPYYPLTQTSKFTGYDRGGFARDDQRELRDVFAELKKRGVKAMLSNSDTPAVHELYDGFLIEKVRASRHINSRADRRGKISELVIRNYA